MILAIRIQYSNLFVQRRYNEGKLINVEFKVISGMSETYRFITVILIPLIGLSVASTEYFCDSRSPEYVEYFADISYFRTNYHNVCDKVCAHSPALSR